ncbi:hypothetical protein HW555_012240 [Spodoptera exigua]|uniref:Uncharacterized protein n=1 Tax=Spodoptera exigua TaxID=7107 RepID=A0A835L3T5_SPOEX|nr:hypothetical protein HW555_012240 [Spodoptera exigua]
MTAKMWGEAAKIPKLPFLNCNTLASLWYYEYQVMRLMPLQGLGFEKLSKNNLKLRPIQDGGQQTL